MSEQRTFDGRSPKKGISNSDLFGTRRRLCLFSKFQNCRLESASYHGKIYLVGVQMYPELSRIQFARTARVKDQIGLSGCLARRKVSGKLSHVIRRDRTIATANLITRFECISGFYSKNEFKMRDRHYPYRLKTGERS